MLIDTHAHLNFNAFKEDYNEVLRNALENNIWVINVGTNYQTSKKAIEIADKHPKMVYAAVGFHPIHLKTGLVKNDKAEKLIKEAKEKKYCNKFSKNSSYF